MSTKMIKLTDAARKGVFWRVPAGAFFYREDTQYAYGKTAVFVAGDGKPFVVRETPEQIDALLATPAPDALVGELVEALGSLLPLVDDGTDAAPEESAVAFARAALAKARAVTPAATGKGE